MRQWGKTYQHRFHIYEDIRESLDLGTDNGIQLEINLNRDQKCSLQMALENYIITTLNSFYDKKFDLGNFNFLVDYRDDILGLPNRTPNGAFYPKKENIKEYNTLQSIVNSTIVETGLIDQIESYDICTVRIVDGRRTDLDKRNSATVKLHSDAWSGQYGDAMVTTALLGDETTSLEFWKPIGMRDEFYDTLPNYEDGTNLYDYPEYLGKLNFGCMTIFDHQCLHRTLKEDGGLRVSIDFSIKLACTELLDKNIGGRNVKHRPKEEVLKIGDETSVEASETLQECYERFKNDKYDGVATSHINDVVK